MSATLKKIDPNFNSLDGGMKMGFFILHTPVLQGFAVLKNPNVYFVYKRVLG
jgi:hypothetical protein